MAMVKMRVTTRRMSCSLYTGFSEQLRIQRRIPSRKWKSLVTILLTMRSLQCLCVEEKPVSFSLSQVPMLKSEMLIQEVNFGNRLK